MVSLKIIIFIAIAGIIMYTVHKLYNKKPKIHKRQPEKKLQNKYDIVEDIMDHYVDKNDNMEGAYLYDTKPESMILNAYPIGDNQIKHNINDNFRYISKDYGCKKPVKSIKQFHKDFFKFRDHTLDNTSIRYDPVDKMMNMKLDGMSGSLTSDNRLSDDLTNYNGNNKKIKNIYDYIVSGVPQYDKQYDEMQMDAI